MIKIKSALLWFKQAVLNNTWTWAPLATILFGLAYVFLMSGDQSAVKEKVVDSPASPAIFYNGITVEQAFAALWREEAPRPDTDSAKAICYNSPVGPGLGAGFFFRYEKRTDSGFDGWYFVDYNKIKFFRASNGSWFTQEIANDLYAKVFPDITGLECKDHP